MSNFNLLQRKNWSDAEFQAFVEIINEMNLPKFPKTIEDEQLFFSSLKEQLNDRGYNGKTEIDLMAMYKQQSYNLKKCKMEKDNDQYLNWFSLLNARNCGNYLKFT